MQVDPYDISVAIHRREHAHMDRFGPMCGDCRQQKRSYGDWLCKYCRNDQNEWRIGDFDVTRQRLMYEHKNGQEQWQVSNNTFGARLRTLRKRNGMSQEELAAKLTEINPDLSASQTTISNLEVSQTMPKIDMVEALCQAFDVDGEFFGYIAPVIKTSRRNHTMANACNTLALLVLDLAYFHATHDAERFADTLEEARGVARMLLD